TAAHGRFGFQGGVFDVATGLYHFGIRDFDPETGRWTEADPSGLSAGDTNLYRFTGNGPTNATHPSRKYLIVTNQNLEFIINQYADAQIKIGSRKIAGRHGWNLLYYISGPKEPGETASKWVKLTNRALHAPPGKRPPITSQSDKWNDPEALDV